MNIKNNTIAIVILVIIFGGVSLSKYMGAWKTESSKVPAKYKTGEFAGKYNPADIRGSYSFADIEDAFQIDVEVIADAFGVKSVDNLPEFKIKDFENIYADLKEKDTEIGTSSVKLFVALYNSLPYELTEDTYVPKRAVEILKKKGNLTEEQLAYLDKHSVDIKENITSNNTSSAKEENAKSEGDQTEEKTVKGNTTFKELIDFGLSKETIEKIIDDKISNEAITVRNYCTEKNIEFSTIKVELQSKLDELNK